MESCLYEGNVVHTREFPTFHSFKYNLFMLCVDLNELPNIFKPYWFWSSKSWNLAYFRRKDHLGNQKVPLETSVRDLVEQKIGSRPQGPIRLITHFCYFGYRINPVSFYFCFDKNQHTLHSIIAEINNTPWGEQHCYVFNCNSNIQNKEGKFTFDKAFHISPFMSMNLKYIWSLTKPSNKFSVEMETWENNKKILQVNFNTLRTNISHASLRRVLIQYPLITFKVLWGIYFQAFRLWLKKVPFHTHPKHQKNNLHDLKFPGAN